MRRLLVLLISTLVLATEMGSLEMVRGQLHQEVEFSTQFTSLPQVLLGVEYLDDTVDHLFVELTDITTKSFSINMRSGGMVRLNYLATTSDDVNILCSEVDGLSRVKYPHKLEKIPVAVALLRSFERYSKDMSVSVEKANEEFVDVRTSQKMGICLLVGPQEIIHVDDNPTVKFRAMESPTHWISVQIETETLSFEELLGSFKIEGESVYNLNEIPLIQYEEGHVEKLRHSFQVEVIDDSYLDDQKGASLQVHDIPEQKIKSLDVHDQPEVVIKSMDVHNQPEVEIKSMDVRIIPEVEIKSMDVHEDGNLAIESMDVSENPQIKSIDVSVENASQRKSMDIDSEIKADVREQQKQADLPNKGFIAQQNTGDIHQEQDVVVGLDNGVEDVDNGVEGVDNGVEVQQQYQTYNSDASQLLVIYFEDSDLGNEQKSDPVDVRANEIANDQDQHQADVVSIHITDDQQVDARSIHINKEDSLEPIENELEDTQFNLIGDHHIDGVQADNGAEHLTVHHELEFDEFYQEYQTFQDLQVDNDDALSFGDLFQQANDNVEILNEPVVNDSQDQEQELDLEDDQEINNDDEIAEQDLDQEYEEDQVSNDNDIQVDSPSDTQVDEQDENQLNDSDDNFILSIYKSFQDEEQQLKQQEQEIEEELKQKESGKTTEDTSNQEKPFIEENIAENDELNSDQELEDTINTQMYAIDYSLFYDPPATVTKEESKDVVIVEQPKEPIQFFEMIDSSMPNASDQLEEQQFIKALKAEQEKLRSKLQKNPIPEAHKLIEFSSQSSNKQTEQKTDQFFQTSQVQDKDDVVFTKEYEIEQMYQDWTLNQMHPPQVQQPTSDQHLRLSQLDSPDVQKELNQFLGFETNDDPFLDDFHSFFSVNTRITKNIRGRKVLSV